MLNPRDKRCLETCELVMKFSLPFLSRKGHHILNAEVLCLRSPSAVCCLLPLLDFKQPGNDKEMHTSSTHDPSSCTRIGKLVQVAQKPLLSKRHFLLRVWLRGFSDSRQDFEGSLRALLRAQECYKDQGNKRLRRSRLGRTSHLVCVFGGGKAPSIAGRMWGWPCVNPASACFWPRTASRQVKVSSCH